MKLTFAIALLYFTSLTVVANQLVLNFSPEYDGNKVSLNRIINGPSKDSIRFDVLRFYISSVSLFKNNKKVFSEPNSFHLVDAESNLQVTISLPESISFDQLRFNLGIDSITNNSGVIGGDLDPTKGMYWTWQSGYINFKLEGVSSNSSDRNHEFQYHLGGYAFPNNSLREITISASDNNRIDIAIDLKKFVQGINISETPHIMSPGKEAMRLSTLIANCFSLK